MHVVDLDAVFGEAPQRSLIEAMARLPQAPPLQLGGGLRDREAVEWAFRSGIDRVVVTSLMVRDFELFSRLANDSPGRMIAALDIEGDSLKLAGWTEAAKQPWPDFAARVVPLPLAAVLVTDIERDGTLAGPNLDLAREVARVCSVGGLLSGGIRSLADLEEARGIPEIVGAIVGKALYDGAFSLADALAVCGGEQAA
ncbi:MAG: HisA/HisF-related TIM barrel protein [Acidobacteria bacterium]|nr:HisA/HisF-related TIM barrel protein [Acidobacteriota bacterium]